MSGDPQSMSIACGTLLGAGEAVQESRSPRDVSWPWLSTWRKLAAETESDGALLRAISEIELGEAFETLSR